MVVMFGSSLKNLLNFWRDSFSALKPLYRRKLKYEKDFVKVPVFTSTNLEYIDRGRLEVTLKDRRVFVLYLIVL